MTIIPNHEAGVIAEEDVATVASIDNNGSIIKPIVFHDGAPTESLTLSDGEALVNSETVTTTGIDGPITGTVADESDTLIAKAG